MKKKTYLTVTDQFCGAGGSSIGATSAGVELRMAINHWPLAVETHNTNFPESDHDCVDISAADPRRYPSTDMLITSPECTTHSPAGGGKRSKPQRDLFQAQCDSPAQVRSRATMWDVPRFAEYHQYHVIVLENVVEVTRWTLFSTWLQAMKVLGYEHRIVSINSMFCHPTPQSRDRIYMVFWRKGNKAPRIDLFPASWCAKCEKQVEARQTWKNGRRLGKYKQQYVYTCPTCFGEVSPYYFAAFNAIDFSIPAKRIGDRAKPLRPRTIERIKYGLEKFGNIGLVVRTNMTTDHGRVRSIVETLHTQNTSLLDSFVAPSSFIAETNWSGARFHPPRLVDVPLPTQSTQQSSALVIMSPLGIVPQRNNNAGHDLSKP